MATLNVAASLTSRLSMISYAPDGDLVLAVDFLDGDGVVRKHKVLRLKADGTGVYDESGAQLSPASPAALVSNLNNIQASVDTTLANLIAAGKITF